MDHFATTLTPSAPYDFDLTASYATYFQKRHAADSYIDGVFCRPLEISGSLCLIEISSLGSIESPELTLVIKGTDLDDRIISSDRERIEGKALRIDDCGALIIEYAKGVQRRILTGDVSLRVAPPDGILTQC